MISSESLSITSSTGSFLKLGVRAGHCPTFITKSLSTAVM